MILFFSIANVSSMLFSTFSHYSGIHFLCNMYVLWSFTEPVIRMFGKEQFCGKLICFLYKFFLFTFFFFLAVFLSGGKIIYFS